jgi:hypothetical protein
VKLDPRTVSLIGGKTGPNPKVLLFFGLFILWGFGYETVGVRLTTQVEGVVVSSRDIPSTGAPRYATEYTLRGADGRESVYTAGPTDAFLPRSMPIGTSIKKQRWHLDYEKNGYRVDDFSIYFYALVMGGASACLIWSLLSWRHQKRLE